MSYIFFLQNVSILVPDICYMRTTLVLSKIIAKSKGFTLLDYLQYFWPFIRRVEGHINAKISALVEKRSICGILSVFMKYYDKKRVYM